MRDDKALLILFKVVLFDHHVHIINIV
ncbi:hypothetical protein D030_5039A, partial [Vibrio parahaemolyticus AQ3810]